MSSTLDEGLMRILRLIVIINICIQFAYANEKIIKEETANKFRYNKVLCSYSEALKIAEKAALDKFPEYKEQILNNEINGFYESHGGKEPDTIIREYRLKYKELSDERPCAFREAIEVVLNNSCEVQEVRHYKGKECYRP